jgi:hypothetical protein
MDHSIVPFTVIADGYVLISQLTSTARIDAGTFERGVTLSPPHLAKNTDMRAVL